MILSGFLSKSDPVNRRSRPGPAQRSPSSLGQGFFSSSSRDLEILDDDSKLLEIKEEDPDLRDLNNGLRTLAAIFPDVQVEVFREMLSTFDEESRLHVVTEALLRHKMNWVKGRWRLPGNSHQTLLPQTASCQASENEFTLPMEDYFRSEEYKKATKAALCQEFRGLSRSTVDGVLAEHNHSYTLARPTLLILSSKSWRSSISSFFLRKKFATSFDPKRHPLVLWRAAEGANEGSPLPVLKSTESPELNRELFDTLVQPLKQQIRQQQLIQDHDVAIQMNELEAEDNNALHDCECCFTSTSFEQLSACDQGRHFICFKCLRHALLEALFGQGWGRNIDHDRCSLRCIAPTLGGGGDCEGCVPQFMVQRALGEEAGGEDIWRKLEDRFAGEELSKSKAALIRCPFCAYAEVDDIYIPGDALNWRIKRSDHLSFGTFLILLFGVGSIPFILPFVVLALSVFLLNDVFNELLFRKQSPSFKLSLHRLARKLRGLKFTCRSTACGRSSCLVCGKEWRDIHICYESERLALRSYVERAMAEAVKRTCPNCNLSFVKASGCNKLTCICGYKMCYVCRKEIGKDGYRHFCEHFRPDGGRACRECDKCDLYRCEDEATAIKRAGKEAEREWRSREGMVHGWSWEGRDDFAGGQRARVSDGYGGVLGQLNRAFQSWRHGDWQCLLDMLVERVVELR
ncbi:MAG: hypothetical protein M1837_003311 [Sclerophora amabilis]|nr:MAG: hypothetical protein M1837_003311 [Sclerophora amabilis]